MNLTTRIEKLEDQFFPPLKTMTHSDVMFVYFLDFRYGSDVEKHLSGHKLYKYRRMKARWTRMITKKPDPTRPPGSPRPILFPELVPKENEAQKPPDSVVR